MANGAAAAAAKAAVEKRLRILRAIRNESLQRVVEVMQEPGPSVASTRAAIGKGAGLGKSGRSSKKQYGPVRAQGGAGRMPIDTGFLRASLVGMIGKGAPALRQRPEGPSSFEFDEGQIVLTITSAELEQPITIAYGAVYARKMELRYGFVRLAVQQWPQIVEAVGREAQARMG